MKIKDEFWGLPKELVYDMYLSLVYDCKDYDNITRTKMFDAIIKEYQRNNYLFHICTTKELEFLDYISNHKLTCSDYQKYEREIEELNRKAIYSKVTFEVFEEQKENVKQALKDFKNKKPHDDYLIIMMIGMVRTNAQMLTKTLQELIKQLFKISDDYFEALLGHPLIHFYCEFSYQWLESTDKDEELINYRDYWELSDEIKEGRIEYGIAGCLKTDIRDNIDMFYYGFPIRNAKVKIMYETINKRKDKKILFHIIEEARVLNNRFLIETFIDDELKKIINDALDEMPCAVMNGFTPNQRKKEQKKQKQLLNNFSVQPQENAHLNDKDNDLYYKLYFALLEYTNNKYNITPKLKKIYKAQNLDVRDLYPINDYLWKNRKILDDFIKDNRYHFSKEELEIIKGFKTAIKSDIFTIVAYDKDYTQILSEDEKIYMVKGLVSNFDEMLGDTELPIVISTTLLMFKGNIIHNSFLAPYPLKFGNDVRELIWKTYKRATKYYHL